MFFVYILYCKTADTFYVGSTDNYERRLIEHNNHEKNKFTSKFDFWELKLVLNCLRYLIFTQISSQIVLISLDHLS